MLKIVLIAATLGLLACGSVVQRQLMRATDSC
jgi:hypothetical protein